MLAIGTSLYNALADFFLRAAGEWNATGKAIPNAIAATDPKIADQFGSAFSSLFKNRQRNSSPGSCRRDPRALRRQNASRLQTTSATLLARLATPNSHHIQHPPRDTLLSAMREVPQRSTLIPGTSRTFSHHRNPRIPHTRIHQLPPIRLPKIQLHRTSIVSAEELLSIPKLCGKLRTHLLPHRIAASPNARSNNRHQILRPRPVLLPHPRNTLLDDTRHRPSPPRMKRANYSLLHIHHQHRNAIRGPHPQQHTRHIGDQPIALQHCLPLRCLQPPLQRSIPLPNHMHDPRVNLPHSHQRKTIVHTTNSRQKSPSILRHQSRVILFRPPQIQRMTPINRRNPAPPRAEPMPQPRVPLQSLHLHNFQPVVSANLLILSAQNQLPTSLYRSKTILECGILDPRFKRSSTTCNIPLSLASTSGASAEVLASNTKTRVPGQGFS